MRGINLRAIEMGREMRCVEAKLRNPIYAEPQPQNITAHPDNPGALLICWWWDVSREIATRHALSASIPPGPFSTSHPRPHPPFNPIGASQLPRFHRKIHRFLPPSFASCRITTRERERGIFQNALKNFGNGSKGRWNFEKKVVFNNKDLKPPGFSMIEHEF